MTLPTRADEDLAFLLRYENVAWYEEGTVRILDRRVYPMKTEFVLCRHHTEVAQAIADMVTQSGGPYAAAAMGMALAGFECRGETASRQLDYLERAAHTLSHARPTTVSNMTKVVESELAAARAALERGEDVVQALFARALSDLNRKYERIEKTGRFLAERVSAHGAVMTQCFAETVVGMLLRACREQGKTPRFFCPETRPYFQGARLTASCIRDMGFDVTVITDNMPGYCIEKQGVELFTSAADVITMDGHVINKVGTFQIALAAQYHGVPYFVTGTPDPGHPDAASVTIEERDPALVLEALGNRTTMEGVKGYYPAFDVTPPTLVAGVVTDRGIYSPWTLPDYYRGRGNEVLAPGDICP